MSDDTAKLGLPLLAPAQAQKHVTVNEALMRLDGMVDLVLQSTTRFIALLLTPGSPSPIRAAATGMNTRNSRLLPSAKSG